MKKTLIALFALSSVAMAADVPAKNAELEPFSGATHAEDQINLNFNDSANRTVTITTTGDATIKAMDGFGLNDAKNVLNLNITGTLTALGTGQIKGCGNANAHMNITTTLTVDELDALINSESQTVSRDILVADYITCLGSKAKALTLTLNGMPTSLVNGGMLVQYNSNFYSMDNVNASGSYWNLDGSATPVTLAENTYYTYVRLTAPNTSAAPKAIGFVAVAPEPATATLSLLALAGLAARRRRH